ncbi:hypothetical protein [Mycobacteroides abscessus]|uniref:hypothetical protein n=1 Tax=Mycobacteroides abscessus TaxID=36809 RepID=UPI0009A5DAE6|nr:hypothetical protein [Mycobacteroides abscessus]SKF26516.1 Uncharacterised protein [Mycobacteroides abscessus subsp. abscessus]SKR34992.1 Uncharacterised protein [Mycobacteroides abscessus subsp. abscessus]
MTNATTRTRLFDPLKLLTLGRATVASSGLFAPNLFAKVFRMNAVGTPAIPMIRMFAVRNALLAAGLARLSAFSAPRTFIGINVLVDAVDAIALIAAGRRHEIPRFTTVVGTWVALSAVGMGAAAFADSRDETSTS